jgi:hypothetical protein
MEVLMNGSFLTPEACNMIFPAGSAVLNCFFLGVLEWTVPSIATWIQVLNGGNLHIIESTLTHSSLIIHECKSASHLQQLNSSTLLVFFNLTSICAIL